MKTTFSSVGTSPIRPDGIDKVTGRAEFGADRYLPGMLVGKVLRSPHAHARILSIDTSAALAINGVKAIVTGDDFADIPEGTVIPGEMELDVCDLAKNIIARDKALYHGHPLAAVAAISEAIAEQALNAISVEYEILQPVLNLEQAVAPNAPLLNEQLFTVGLPDKPTKPSNVASIKQLAFGDVEAAFSQAHTVIEDIFTTPTVHQGYIEPQAVTASCNRDGKASVWCCTQGPFAVRALSALVLDWPLGKIKVTPSEIGGGFGGKTTVYLEPIAIKLSQLANRPVRMVLTRDEVFRATGPTSATQIQLKLAADANGTLLAGQAILKYESGAFKGSPVMPGMMCIFAPYQIAAFDITGHDILVNKPKAASYRAPGAPAAAFAMESMMDRLAIELAIDPIELRLKNAACEGSRAPYGIKFPPIGLVETLQAAKQHPHYSAPLEPNQGRGIASGFWFNIGFQSTATVNINEDGTVSVVTGSPDIGGSRASMALMAAEELGVDYETIEPLVGDTESAGYSDITGGSRTTFATGMAVIKACQEVIEQLCNRATKLWQIDRDHVYFSEGSVCTKADINGDKQSLSIPAFAQLAAKTGGPISGRCSINAQGAGAGFATHICDVEVDPETGKLDVIRYTAIQDAGKAVHPAYVEGQLQGGAVQGIGWALNEAYCFDDQGRMENPSFLDYRIPVALDLPMIDTVIVEVPNPSHPYGVRGVGETPIVPPLAAVANAVRAATDIRFRDLPLSPPRVLAAINQKEAF